MNTVTRFDGPDGHEYVSVVVARSRPFAAAVLAAWTRLDGVDRRHMLDFKAFTMPAAVFDGPVVQAARAALEPRERESAA